MFEQILPFHLKFPRVKGPRVSILPRVCTHFLFFPFFPANSLISRTRIQKCACNFLERQSRRKSAQFEEQISSNISGQTTQFPPLSWMLSISLDWPVEGPLNLQLVEVEWSSYSRGTWTRGKPPIAELRPTSGRS